MSSSKTNSKTILELTEAYDEGKNKRYKKGKFLGKVTPSVLSLFILVSIPIFARVVLLTVMS